MDVSAETFDESIAINTRAPLLVSQVCCSLCLVLQFEGKHL